MAEIPDTVRDKAAWVDLQELDQHGDGLTSWEAEFVESLTKRLRAGEDGESSQCGGTKGPKKGPTGHLTVLDGAVVRVPVSTRLPMGLSEAELMQGYRRPRSAWCEAAGQVPHPVEVVALGAVLACVIAALLGVWPWCGGGS